MAEQYEEDYSIDADTMDDEFGSSGKGLRHKQRG
jgi:hypothetical protein